MKQKMFASIWKYNLDQDEPEVVLTQEAKSNADLWVSLGETEVSFDCPPMPSDEELTNRQIDYLRKGREETVKEFTTKLANIDEQINELLALPCLGGEE